MITVHTRRCSHGTCRIQRSLDLAMLKPPSMTEPGTHVFRGCLLYPLLVEHKRPPFREPFYIRKASFLVFAALQPSPRPRATPRFHPSFPYTLIREPLTEHLFAFTLHLAFQAPKQKQGFSKNAKLMIVFFCFTSQGWHLHKRCLDTSATKTNSLNSSRGTKTT